MKYKVRNYTLHKVVVDEDGSKSTQPYKPGSTVELTEDEAKRYRHLVQPLKSTKEAAK